MNSRRLIAVLSSVLILTACQPSAEKEVTIAPVAATESAPMVEKKTLAVSTSSDEALGHYNTGWTAFEMGRNNEANDHFRMAIKADPSFAMGYLMTALSATSTEGFASSLAKASEHASGASRGEQLAIETYQHAFDADEKGRMVSAKALTDMHPDSPQVWVFLAQAHTNQNDSAGTIKALNRALAVDPSFAMAHMQLGNTYLFLEPKDFAKAEMHIKKAVAIAPNEPNPHDLLGDVHRAQGNLKAAYDDYTKAAELAPKYGSPLQQRGHVNAFLGNYDEARADYTRAAELETARGTNNAPFYLVYKAYVSLYEGEPKSAIAELRQLAADVDKTNLEGKMDLKINAFTDIARIATDMGDEQTAADAIAKVAALSRQQAAEVGTEKFRNAQEANIAYLEGMLAARMGDAKGAQAKAEQFKKHVASSTSARKLERMHEIEGMTAFHQKNYAAAAEHLAGGDIVNNVYTKYHLAMANDKAGNADAAKNMLDEIAVYNFSDVGYGMTRGHVIARSPIG